MIKVIKYKTEVVNNFTFNYLSIIQGYYTALERTMFLGQPDDASLR